MPPSASLRPTNSTRPPRRHYRRKDDLRAVKAAYPPFTGFRIDVKYLTGIPFFWPQMQHNGWPRFQYTIRELSCGAQFLADSSRCYKSPADLLALKAPHLSPKIFFLYPIPLESLLHLTGGHDVPGRMKTFASDPDPKNC